MGKMFTGTTYSTGSWDALLAQHQWSPPKSKHAQDGCILRTSSFLSLYWKFLFLILFHTKANLETMQTNLLLAFQSQPKGWLKRHCEEVCKSPHSLQYGKIATEAPTVHSFVRLLSMPSHLMRALGEPGGTRHVLAFHRRGGMCHQAALNVQEHTQKTP